MPGTLIEPASMIRLPDLPSRGIPNPPTGFITACQSTMGIPLTKPLAVCARTALTSTLVR